MQLSVFRAAVFGGDLYADVFRVGLGVFDGDIEITVFVKDAGVDQFKFGLVFAAAAVFVAQQLVGKFGLRVFVELLDVGMGRGRVEIIINFLDVLAVIALRIAESEKPLF